MPHKYQDIYYNHFSKSKKGLHTPLTKHKNYLMRFNTLLPYSYAKEQNSLSIVYSNSLQPMNLITPAGSSKLKKNTFTVINPQTNWEFICDQDNRVDVLSFVLSEEVLSKVHFYTKASAMESLDTPFNTKQLNSFFIENIYNANYNNTGRYLKNIYDISNTDEFEFLSADEIVFDLLEIAFKEQLYYNQKIKNIKGKKTSTKKEVFKRIAVACEYLHDTFEIKKVDIDELALVAGLSEYHLYSSFKAIFQKTPHQYLNQLRMQKAKQYVDRQQMTLSEISDTLQFPDLSSFSKLFKKTYGVAPSKLIVQ